MLTTAGVTRSSIGASEGSGWPSTTGGSDSMTTTRCTALIKTSGEKRSEALFKTNECAA